MKSAVKQKAYEKFEFLLKPNLIKTLPMRHQNLHKIFKALETIISFHKTRSNGSHIIFDKIKRALENTADLAVTITDLSRICFIAPDLFQVDYSKVLDDGSISHTLRVDWAHYSDMNDVRSTLKIRQDIFEAKLIGLVNDQHQKYISENNLEIVGTNVYHAKFIENGPEVPTSDKVDATVITPVAKDSGSVRDVCLLAIKCLQYLC